VIRFKQGFGRLIRHRNDRGVVLILDTRVVRRGYGRMFLRSLPPARVVRGASDEVFAAIGQFFQRQQGGCDD
jgi:ATP-dependent DNA helicase DinG